MHLIFAGLDFQRIPNIIYIIYYIYIKFYIVTDNILRCMMFLRQAGLWEQLWLLIELYLELTYTTAGSGAFKVNIEIPEQEIRK